MKYVEGHTQAEIAGIVGRKNGAVAGLIHRATVHAHGILEDSHERGQR